GFISPDDQNRALVFAAEEGYPKAAKVLLTEDWNPSFEDNLLFRMATNYASLHWAVADILLAHPKFTPGTKHHHILVWAVYSGYIETVKYLLTKPEIDPSYDDNAALLEAVERLDRECVELLLADPRVDPSARNNLALTTILEEWNVDVT